MEYVTKEKLVEMYEKGKEVADLKRESAEKTIIGMACGGAAALSGSVAYFFRGPRIGGTIFLGAASAVYAVLSYLNLRNASKHDKKAKGLEKEIEAELEKE